MTKRQVVGALCQYLERGESAVLVSSTHGCAVFGVLLSEVPVGLLLVASTFKETATESIKSALTEFLFSGGSASGKQGRVQKLTLPELSGKPLMAFFYTPPPTLLICGAGHIAVPLAKLGGMLDFRVAIFDDRPTFADPARFPEADEVVCGPFAELVKRVKITPNCYAVIVTRGHRHDGLCLRQLVGTSAAYLGMIGSRRRVMEMKEIMLAEGFAADKLAALHAPIGLAIGAETPAEIAVSIIAEIVKVRNAANSRSNLPTPEFSGDLNLLSTIAQEPEATPLVLATVVETIGSTPRGVGAQMLCFPDGRTLGSIGGGCAEAEVRSKAMLVMGSGVQLDYEVDMSGTVAEDEGMVCGGTMLVHLQPV